MSEPILSVREFCVDYLTADGPIRALDRISLELKKGEILGIAGESGSGKSTFAQAVLRIAAPPALITGGEAIFEGKDLLKMNDAELHEVRWKRASLVFQSAMDVLNPVLTVGAQIRDILRAHTKMTRAEETARANELVALVELPKTVIESYAHQLSGGMRQRAVIALALSLQPQLVILDEPTTALDVIVEREILQSVLALRARLGFSVIFITHDLARMLEICDRVAIFYAGRLIEIAPAAELRDDPKHPYTRKLLTAFPSVRNQASGWGGIPGSPPSLAHPPGGCRFHPRCEVAFADCSDREPPLIQINEQHKAACLLLEPEL